MRTARKFWLFTPLVLTLAAALWVLVPHSSAHIEAQRPSTGSPPAVKDEIPEAVLLTERGRQLAEELKQLRRSEAALAPKHPLYSEVQSQIEAVKEQIEAWSPRVSHISGVDAEALPEVLPEMSDRDLRQLVLRMAAKISQLEGRVQKLETRLEVH